MPTTNEKAICIRIYGIDYDSTVSGQYTITADAVATDGQGGSTQVFQVQASAAIINPVLGGTWKARLKTAILVYIENNWPDNTANEVVFPDLSIL